ncbi:MAG: hypothetical protein ACLFR0_02165 [Alphaproteobacteria bacterium]
MKTLLDKTSAIFSAAALAIGIGAGSNALANEQVASNDTQTVSLQQDEIRYATPEEARLASAPAVEGGAGKVVLLVGENFDPEILASLERSMQRENYNYEILSGGDRDNHLQLFIAGGQAPDYFDAETAHDVLIGVIAGVQHKFNLNIYALNTEDDNGNTLEAG